MHCQVKVQIERNRRHTAEEMDLSARLLSGLSLTGEQQGDQVTQQEMDSGELRQLLANMSVTNQEGQTTSSDFI